MQICMQISLIKNKILFKIKYPLCIHRTYTHALLKLDIDIIKKNLI